MASSSGNVVQLHGIKFPSTLDIRHIKEAAIFLPDEGDVILTCYPNAGEDWLQHIALKLLGRNHLVAGPSVTFKIVPVLERAGTRLIETLYPPRVYKHHLPYHMVRKNPLAKTVYIYRKPEDVFAAYYFHKCRLEGRKVSLEQTFDQFSSGTDMEYGRFFEHARSYFRYQNSSNVLMVSYDKLYHCPRQELLRLSKFLDEEFYDHLMANESSLQEMLEMTKYQHIPCRSSIPFDSAFSARPQPGETYRPIEVVGGGKKILTASQIKKLYDITARVLQTLNLFEEQIPEGAGAS